METEDPTYFLEYRLGLALSHAIKFNIHSPNCFLTFLYKFKYLTKKRLFPSNINLSETQTPHCWTHPHWNVIALVRRVGTLATWSLKRVSHCGEGTCVFEVSSKCLSAQNGYPPEPTARPPKCLVSEGGSWKKMARKRDSRMLKIKTAQTSSHCRRELQTKSKSVTIKPASLS